MRQFQAQVQQKLVISDAGVDQYMQVESQDAGQLVILPSPSIGALYAQATAKARQPVQVLEVGTVRDVNWGILLDDQGRQYGFPMSYEPRDLSRNRQVIYIANSKHFPRLQLRSSGKPSKRSIDCLVLNNQTIALHYATLAKDADLDQLKAYEGFAVSTPGILKRGTSYQIWFALTSENLRQAVEDPTFKGIQALIKSDQYSFVTRADHFDVKQLEGMLAKAEAEEAKTASVNIHTKKQARFNIPAGEYTAQQLAQYVTTQKYKVKMAKISAELSRHIIANNPVTLDGKLLHKNQTFTLRPGGNYEIVTGKVAAPTAAQPKYVPTVSKAAPPPEREAPRAEPPPPEQPAYVPKPVPEEVAPAATVTPAEAPKTIKIEPIPSESAEERTTEAKKIPFTATKKVEQKPTEAGTRPQRKEKVEGYRKAAGGG